MTEYLEGAGKMASRKLWEAAFPEDSASFLDFYYREIIKENKVLAAVEEGRVISMLHRNPYEVMVSGRRLRSDYIVGVATDSRKRHQGYMRSLLTRAAHDMYEEDMAFCFLMPADQAIYLPFGFAYIFDQPRMELSERGEAELEARRISGSEEDYEAAARFMERFLQERYEVRTWRDSGYVRRLERETESDGGGLFLLHKRCGGEIGALAGVRAHYGEEPQVLRELLCLEEYVRETAPPRPAIMARIVNPFRFAENIRLKEESSVAEMTAVLTISDPLIPANNGDFLWKLDKRGSRLEQPSEPPADCPRVSLSVGELTGWLFGYGEQVWAARSLPAWCGEVRALRGVYLDEII